jgi:hypothetical protein
MPESDPAGARDWTLSGARVTAFSILLLVDFALVVVMLATDKNLQSDFGSLHPPPYFAHWYGLLVEGIADLVGALVLLVVVARPAMQGKSVAARRWLMRGGFLWTVLAIVAMVGIVESYQMVGFSSATQFAQYLFQPSPYPGAEPYIPWLYDALLAAYLLTALVGAMAMMRVRSRTAGAASA